jgi:saccharopine dehydrogenase-like NADP-dependent oxidoreductase
MRICCKGNHKDKPQTVWVNTVEYYDKETGFSAMGKWTGWHASILLIAAAHGKLEKGVIPVEKAMTGTKFKKEAELRNYEISITVT